MRRSKRQSVTESLRSVFGSYPFRCTDCGNRQYASVWLLSKLGTAKCPKCLSTQVVAWPEKHFRTNALQNLLITFGAQRCRCMACRQNFLSFGRRAGSRPADNREPLSRRPQTPVTE